MKTPETVREQLTLRWRRDWTRWAVSLDGFPVQIGLSPPTAATAGEHWSYFLSWIRHWDAGPFAPFVQWEDRKWSRLGSQRVPVRLAIPDPAALARLVGELEAHRFEHAVERAKAWSTRWPMLDGALSGMVEWLVQLSDDDFDRATACVEWLALHAPAGLFVRQLPIPGIDSKWIERNRGLVTAALAAVLGVDAAPLEVLAGLRTDLPRRRLRVLDEQLCLRAPWVRDVSLPGPDIAQALVDLKPSAVLIVENLQTFLALEPIDGAVAVFGKGLAALELAGMPYLHTCQVVYWGDIDTMGFFILSELRRKLRHVESVLMDACTLQAYAHLATEDLGFTAAACDHLRLDEAKAHQQLLEGTYGSASVVRARLEQERIPWDYAWPIVVDAAGAR